MTKGAPVRLTCMELVRLSHQGDSDMDKADVGVAIALIREKKERLTAQIEELRKQRDVLEAAERIFLGDDGSITSSGRTPSPKAPLETPDTGDRNGKTAHAATPPVKPYLIHPGGDKPPRHIAVARILRQAGRPMKTAEISDALVKNGDEQEPLPDSFANTLTTVMVRKDDIFVKTGPGTFSLREFSDVGKEETNGVH